MNLDEITWVQPWEPTLSIDFVSELKKEIAPDHWLWNRDIVSVAKRRDCDDVLFYLSDGMPSFVVVHLTWQGQQEKAGFPSMTKYESLTDWIELGMKPDHDDYVRSSSK